MEVTIVYQPAGSYLINPDLVADDYFESFDGLTDGLLTELRQLNAGQTPICLMLPDDTGEGLVCRPAIAWPDSSAPVPAGFKRLDLHEATYFKFHSRPFARSDWRRAIDQLRKQAARFDPADLNYVWDRSLPQIRFWPQPEVGYIEMHGVKSKDLNAL